MKSSNIWTILMKGKITKKSSFHIIQKIIQVLQKKLSSIKSPRSLLLSNIVKDNSKLLIHPQRLELLNGPTILP